MCSSGFYGPFRVVLRIFLVVVALIGYRYSDVFWCLLTVDMDELVVLVDAGRR